MKNAYEEYVELCVTAMKLVVTAKFVKTEFASKDVGMIMLATKMRHV